MSTHEDLFFFFFCKACMKIKNRKLELCFFFILTLYISSSNHYLFIYLYDFGP